MEQFIFSLVWFFCAGQWF